MPHRTDTRPTPFPGETTTIFYFHVRSANEFTLDNEGADLTDYAAAKAVLPGREHLADAVKCGKAHAQEAFVIAAASEKELGTFPLATPSAEAVQKQTRITRRVRTPRKAPFHQLSKTIRSSSDDTGDHHPADRALHTRVRWSSVGAPAARYVCLWRAHRRLGPKHIDLPSALRVPSHRRAFSSESDPDSASRWRNHLRRGQEG